MLINIEKRNRDFVNSVEAVLNSGGKVSVDYAVRQALKSAPGGFYLSRDYAYRALHARRARRLPPRENNRRRQMWEELDKALEERRRIKPRESEWEALDWVLDHHRPTGYFLDEEYAKKLYNRCTCAKGKIANLPHHERNPLENPAKS